MEGVSIEVGSIVSRMGGGGFLCFISLDGLGVCIAYMAEYGKRLLFYIVGNYAY